MGRLARAVRLLNGRRIRRSPMRTALAVAAVAGGVSVAVSVAVLSHSLETTINNLVRSLAGPAPLRIVGPATRAGLADTVTGVVGEVDGVKTAVPAVQAVAIAEDAAGRPYPVFAVGVDCRVEALVGAFGCDPAEMEPTGQGPFALSGALAQQLGPDGVIRTDAGRVAVDGAAVNPFLDDLNGGALAVFALPEAQRLFDRNGLLDAVYVEPERGADLEVVRERIAEAVGPWNFVLARYELAPNETPTGPLIPLLGMVAVFALGLAALLVYNTVALTMAERRRDLAIVSAVGARRSLVVGGAVLEATVVGIAGGLVGSLGGILLARPLISSMNSPTAGMTGVLVELHLKPTHVVVGLVIGAVCASLAAAVPAWRGSRLDLAAELHGRAMRQEATRRRTGLRVAILSAIGLSGVGLTWLAARDGGLEPWQPTLAMPGMLLAAVFLFAAAGAAAPLALRALLPLTARLGGSLHMAVTTASREPRRTGVMAVAAGTAVGLATVLGSLGPAIRETVRTTFERGAEGRAFVSTLPINNSSRIDSGIPPEVLTALQQLPEVDGLVLGSFVALRDERGDIAVVGTERLTVPHPVLMGTFDEGRLAAGEVAIGLGVARSLGIRPGDTIELPGPRGYVEFPVAAIWADPNNNGGGVTMSLDRLEAVWGPQREVDAMVQPAAGVTAVELVTAIEAAHLDPDLYALTPGELTSQLTEEVEAQSEPFWALQRMLLAVTLVAALSTMLLVGVQRRRELGILGAVGLGPSRLAGTTLAEAAVVGIVGSLLGSVAGVAVFSAMLNATALLVGVRPPFRVDFATPLIYATVACGVVLVGAALPAWRTARLQIVEALQYE